MKAHAAGFAALLLGSPATAEEPIDAIAKGAGASVALGQWCGAHGLGKLAALRSTFAKGANAQVRAALHAARGEPIGYRRVSLGCGGRTLSTADNWYRPAVLTAAMNQTLATSDAPFGLVVQPLGFHRVTLAARGREIRALLIAADGRAFSYVVERYAPLPSR